MKFSSELPAWVVVPLRVAFYLLLGFILYNIAAAFVAANLVANIRQCSEDQGGSREEPLAVARRMVTCVEQRNGFLEDLAFRRIRSAIDGMPSNPKEFVGRWNSSQPRCQYEPGLQGQPP